MSSIRVQEPCQLLLSGRLIKFDQRPIHVLLGFQTHQTCVSPSAVPLCCCATAATWYLSLLFAACATVESARCQIGVSRSVRGFFSRASASRLPDYLDNGRSEVASWVLERKHATSRRNKKLDRQILVEVMLGLLSLSWLFGDFDSISH